MNAIAPGVVDNEHWDDVDARFARYEGLPPGEKKRRVGAAPCVKKTADPAMKVPSPSANSSDCSANRPASVGEVKNVWGPMS